MLCVILYKYQPVDRETLCFPMILSQYINRVYNIFVNNKQIKYHNNNNNNNNNNNKNNIYSKTSTEKEIIIKFP